MKEFKPSDDFVSRVMKGVYAYEGTTSTQPSFAGRFVSLRLARYALSAGGVMLGIVNLIRLYLTVFSPVVCR